jgi:hypothetical protein
VSYIFISKDVLQDTGWYIQRSADLFDKTDSEKYRPSVIGYCPVCDAQHTLMYTKQSDDFFFFECLKCTRGF